MADNTKNVDKNKKKRTASNKTTNKKSSNNTVETKKTNKQAQASSPKSEKSRSTKNKNNEGTTSTINKAPKKNTSKKTASSKKTSKTNSTKKAPTKSSTPTVENEKVTHKETNVKIIEEVIDIEQPTPDIVKELHVEESSIETKEEKNANKLAAKTLLGADLTYGNEAQARRSRKKSYSKDALIFATIIPVLDLLAMLFIDNYKPILVTNNTVTNLIMTLILDFILIYIVTYLIDFVIGEEAVKKNK